MKPENTREALETPLDLKNASAACGYLPARGIE
jgi:hypothetical protein